jgi:VIT family
VAVGRGARDAGGERVGHGEAFRHPDDHVSDHVAGGEVLLGVGPEVQVALWRFPRLHNEQAMPVVTSGLAEVAAGSIVMGLGGYLAARGEAEHYQRERRREEAEVVEQTAAEEAEVVDILRTYGVDDGASAAVVQALNCQPIQPVHAAVPAYQGSTSRVDEAGPGGRVRWACVRAGLPAVGPHRLRHTAATAMLRAGAHLPDVGQVLRSILRRRSRPYALGHLVQMALGAGCRSCQPRLMMSMRNGAMALGIAGGALCLVGAIAALVAGGADTVIVGSWVTVVAAVVGIAGATFVGSRPGWSALLMAIAAVAAGLVAPGVIPAIGDMAAVILPYLAGGALLLVGAILAFVCRSRAPSRTSVGRA